MGGGFVDGTGRFGRTKNGREKAREIVRAAEESRRRKPSADHRKHRKHNQRAKHAPRRFVDVNVMFVVALLSVEGQEYQPEHVKRSEQCGEQADGVKRMPACDLKRAKQDGVLAEEAGERRNSRDG